MQIIFSQSANLGWL